jgi:hypothetical protein
MAYRSVRFSVAVLVAVAGALVAVSANAGAASPSGIQVISDAALKPQTATIGGAPVLKTTRTVTNWHGQTTDPNNGVTYGYNMVGVDPSTNASATVGVDIIPLNLNVAGQAFNGTDNLGGVLASPLFTTGDYSTTSAASDSSGGKGSGGGLSAGNDGVQLQDATMRAQFNKVGTGYHLVLDTPIVHDAITIDVPAEHGTRLQSGRGVIYADVNIQWFATKIQNLISSLGYVDPTRLPLFVTNDVVLYIGSNPGNCCVIGFHGAGIVPGRTAGPGHGNGNQPVQTYAWASWMTAGFFRPSTGWVLQDINAFSHEIAEWADDPFVNNTVEPWLTPTAPQYGCTSVLETGDPVVGIGFSQGTNTFDQGPAPNGTKYTDGTYHPEDEVYLPWFMRSAPNLISQATQTSSANIGRYTLMGDLNPFAGFRQPATGC